MGGGWIICKRDYIQYRQKLYTIQIRQKYRSPPHIQHTHITYIGNLFVYYGLCQGT